MHTAVLTRLLDQFRSDLEPHVQVLNNVKDITDPSAPDEEVHLVRLLIWIGKENNALEKNCMRYFLNLVQMLK